LHQKLALANELVNCDFSASLEAVNKTSSSGVSLFMGEAHESSCQLIMVDFDSPDMPEIKKMIVLTLRIKAHSISVKGHLSRGESLFDPIDRILRLSL